MNSQENMLAYVKTGKQKSFYFYEGAVGDRDAPKGRTRGLGRGPSPWDLPSTRFSGFLPYIMLS